MKKMNYSVSLLFGILLFLQNSCALAQKSQDNTTKDASAAATIHVTTPDVATGGNPTVLAQPGTVFAVNDPTDLELLRMAEGAKMSNTTLPSGKVVPVPPEGMEWRVRKGQIVLEKAKQPPPNQASDVTSDKTDAEKEQARLKMSKKIEKYFHLIETSKPELSTSKDSNGKGTTTLFIATKTIGRFATMDECEAELRKRMESNTSKTFSCKYLKPSKDGLYKIGDFMN